MLAEEGVAAIAADQDVAPLAAVHEVVAVLTDDNVVAAVSKDFVVVQAALQGILNEWASGHTYNARVNNIRTGGGFTGGFAFNAGTVFGDGAVDTLWGKEDQDWFLIGASDILKDKAANELVN